MRPWTASPARSFTHLTVQTPSGVMCVFVTTWSDPEALPPARFPAPRIAARPTALWPARRWPRTAPLPGLLRARLNFLRQFQRLGPSAVADRRGGRNIYVSCSFAWCLPRGLPRRARTCAGSALAFFSGVFRAHKRRASPSLFSAVFVFELFAPSVARPRGTGRSSTGGTTF